MIQVKSLQVRCPWAFNGGMKLKILMGVIAAVCIFCSIQGTPEAQKKESPTGPTETQTPTPTPTPSP
jgi:hypothetical protein